MIQCWEDPVWLAKVIAHDEAIPTPAAGITIVQHKSTFASGNTVSLAFTSNITAGNTLIYVTASQDTTPMSPATDNNSNTIVNANSVGTGGGSIRVDYVSSANSGATTVTGTTAVGAARSYIFIWEISGLTSKTLDKQNTGQQTGTNQTISTVATTAANELVVGAFFDQPNDDSLTVGSGYGPSEFVDSGAGNESGLVEVKIVSATGVQTATCTCGSNTNIILQSITTYK